MGDNDIALIEEMADFKGFLQQNGNDRIIFSGIFGAGKTTFLKHFFEQNPENYLSLHLFPSNYSVVGNDDIFHLIKYDILYEIVSKKPTLEKNEVSLVDSISVLDAKRQWDVIKALLQAIPKLGKPLKDLVSSIQDVISILEKNRNELRSDEGKLIEGFINGIEEGYSLYENDSYTKLIATLIERLKSNGKEVVLIIDDLDRIDPEHIFRILNVFAAHFDVAGINLSGQKNKFNIDTVILVCDIENVRSIFKHRYGVSSDFNGYIDKFYSKGIYFYNLHEKVIKKVQGVLSSVSASDEAGRLVFLNQRKFPHIGAIEGLLASMILSNKLNLRDFYRIKNKSYKVPLYRINLFGKDYHNWQFPALLFFDFLEEILGGFTKMRDMIYNTPMVALANPRIIKTLEADLCLILQFKKAPVNLTLDSFTVDPEIYKSNNNPIMFQRQSGIHDDIYHCYFQKEDVFWRDQFQQLLLNAVDFYKELKSTHLDPKKKLI